MKAGSDTGYILTFAAEKGKTKPNNLHSPFAERIAQYITRFLSLGRVKGTLDLKHCLRQIPSYVAHTEVNFVPKDITIYAKVPKLTVLQSNNSGEEGTAVAQHWYPNGSIYAGNLLENGAWNGKAALKLVDGSSYIGEF